MDESTHRAEISEFTGTAYILRKRGFVNQLEVKGLNLKIKSYEFPSYL